MGPVHQATVVVPDVLAVKSDRVPLAQAVEPRRKVDIVGDHQRLAAGRVNHKALMRGSVAIV